MTPLRRAMREALALAVAATVLGFLYTGIGGKGIFASEKSSPSISQAAPTMIHLQEARELQESGEALFIDARHPMEFARGHIPGALNIPLGELDQRKEQLEALPRDKILVTYCDGVQCNSSLALAVKLREAGFPSIRVFFSGWNEWTGNNLPVEATVQ